MADAFKLDFTTGVLDSLREITRVAILHGQGKVYSACLQSLIEKLMKSGRDCGEPLFDLRKISMQVRMLTEAPLSLTYGVHTVQPVVVVRSVVDMQPKTDDH